MQEHKKASANLRGTLKFLNGPLSGQEIKLRRDATILGRDSGNLVILDDSEVSSNHCQIQKVGEDYQVFDMNSTNGTFVNDQRIVKAKLKSGDVLTVGRTKFKFALEEEANVRHLNTTFHSSLKKSDTKTTFLGTVLEKEIAADRISGMVLSIQYPDKQKEEVQLFQKLVFIGRSTPFGKFEKDSELSRKHFLIKLNDHGELFIEDQNSTNGTFLNNQRIKGMHKFDFNDEIFIGSGIRIRVKPLAESASGRKSGGF
ncbi:MAG: FHA domain-containing protein [Oligoflexales bacterium]|nr:FHA domain-containing protein [Oligoflexales bacterium]